MKTEGAREVARAFREGRCLTKGNARTDGTTYYLFDNPIARKGPADAALQVKARLLDDDTQLLHLSWAGWPTKSTERHLNVVCAEFGRLGRAWCKNARKDPRPMWITKGWEIPNDPAAEKVVADPHRWYPITELAA
jgi:hypothetical protein